MLLLELANTIGLNFTKVSNTHGGEYKGPCPRCFGKDRFIIQPNRQGERCIGFYYCRQCQKGGDTVSFCIEFMDMAYKDAMERANATVSPVKHHLYQIKKFTPREIYLLPPKKIWISKATEFTERTHRILLQDEVWLQYLNNRGISRDAVIQYKLGYNPSMLLENRNDWGLDIDGDFKFISLPQGIVIPFIERSGSITRLKIRRSDYVEESPFGKYKIIKGSMAGSSIIGDRNLKIMIVVESELDCYAVHHGIGDFACVVAVGGSNKNLDNVTVHIGNTKKYILVCHDNDKAGNDMFEKWKVYFSSAIACPTPFGKDIGEAIEQGLNVREWILGKIPISLHPRDIE